MNDPTITMTLIKDRLAVLTNGRMNCAMCESNNFILSASRVKLGEFSDGTSLEVFAMKCRRCGALTFFDLEILPKEVEPLSEGEILKC